MEPKLFNDSGIDSKDDLEDRHLNSASWIGNSHYHDPSGNPRSEKETHESLASAVSKDPKSHDDVCLGLLSGILLDPSKADRYYRDLTWINRDGLSFVLNHMTHLVLDKWVKMTQSVKGQILWITRQMIASNVTGTDSLCWNLMRQIAGGDVSRSNLWLADSLLDIFVEHKAWLDKFSFLLASVVYTYLRVIEDHFALDKLRDKEVKFITSLIRQRFNDVIVIGRDFLRVLQYVAKIKEFEDIWHDILYNPKALSPTFTGITILMHTRTSRRFLQSRITPEMERKLAFLTSQVRFGTHKRYQEWFQKQYLSTNESQSLRCDLIRFIVGVIHPTNELLCSDIIPRWAVIGWLLTTCTSPVAASNSKLSLFYDWLFFQSDKDNIMNIEPAILVMYHSLRPHPAITATLLDFLCRILTSFHPKEQDKVRNGIYNSLHQILGKGVVPSLSPLFDNPKVDSDLRNMLREQFSPFISSPANTESIEPGVGFSDEENEEDNNANHHNKNVISTVQKKKKRKRSIDDESVRSILAPEVKRPKSEEKESAVEEIVSPTLEHSSKENESDNDEEKNNDEEDDDEDDDLDEGVKNMLKSLKEETSSSKRISRMENLLKLVAGVNMDFEECSSIASSLSEILRNEFEDKLYTGDWDEARGLSSALDKPVFAAFKSVATLGDHDSGRTALLNLLAELYALQPRVGYFLLFYIKLDPRMSKKDAKSKAGLYRDLCETIDTKFSLDLCLVNDMRQCLEDDVDLFIYLIPNIFAIFPKYAVGNVDLIYLIVSCADGKHTSTLVSHLLSKSFVMVKKDSVLDVLSASLSWETFEQYVLWQLLNAHDLHIECFVPFIPKLDEKLHSESVSFLAVRLKGEKPTAEIVKALTSKEPKKKDKFVSSLLIYWFNGEYADKLSDIISQQLYKQSGSNKDSGGGGGGGSSGKKKRSSNKSSSNGTGSIGSSVEATLSHLNQLKRSSRCKFFEYKSISSALNKLKNHLSDNQRRHFSELFASVDVSAGEDDEEDEDNNEDSSSGKKPSKSSGSVSGKKPVKQLTDSSDENIVESTEKVRSGNKRGRGKPPRKRSGKISYKEAESTDDSSDGTDVPKRKKKKRFSESE